MTNAFTSPEIALLLSRVPEFNVPLQTELREEESELGAFQAVSLLARWVLERLRESPGDDAARRTFDAVEELLNHDGLQLASELAVDFVEGVWEDRTALTLMGGRTRELAEPSR